MRLLVPFRRSPAVVLLLCALGGRAAAQQRSAAPGGTGPLEFSLSAGRPFSRPDAFANSPDCPSSRAFTGSAGLLAHLGQRIALEVSGDYVFGNRTVTCAAPPVAPPPATGPYTRTSAAWDPALSGYPFVQTTARAYYIPAHDAYREFRVYAGFGRIWSKKTNYPQVGLAALTGSGRVRFSLQADLTFYSVGRDSTVTQFQDAVQVSQVTTRSTVRDRSFTLRAGMVIPLSSGR